MKDVPIGAIVAMPIKGVINCYLVGFQACSTQGNPHPVLLISSRPHAWPGRSQALDGPTAVILLCEHVTLASKHLCFLPADRCSAQPWSETCFCNWLWKMYPLRTGDTGRDCLVLRPTCDTCITSFKAQGSSQKRRLKTFKVRGWERVL